MTRSKKWFVGLSIVFLILLAIASYDISRQTTFPGSKPQLPDRIKKSLQPIDSIREDTTVLE